MRLSVATGPLKPILRRTTTSSTVNRFSIPFRIAFRAASSFVPGVATSDPAPALPKPPSTNWFTTHPALSDSLSKLDDLIHRSRQELYKIRVLKRYAASPDFSGTGVRLKWLRWKIKQDSESSNCSEEKRINYVLWNNQMKWHELGTMAILLQGNEGRPLRMIEYNHALGKLNELKALKRYLLLVKNLQLSTSHNIEELDKEITKTLLLYSRPESQHHTSKNQASGRDHLGRFYGLGRKKESTARAWIIEVKVSESCLQKAPVETAPSDAAMAMQPTYDESALKIGQDLVTSASTMGLQPNHEESDSIQQDSPTESIEIPLGKINVNGRSVADYFYTPRQRATAIRPLEITSTIGHYNVHILTHGGGKMGQAAATSHAVANALMKALQEAAKTDGSAQERYARKVLAKSQLTLRDPRVVERKKTGKPGAKSSYRWVKR